MAWGRRTGREVKGQEAARLEADTEVRRLSLLAEM